MATASLDLELAPLEGESRPLNEWLTTFPLVPVVLDPYTHESAWILDTARRVLKHFTGADCRPCWITICNADDARRFLGPYADEFLTFADPSGAVAKGLGLTATPGVAMIRQDGEVVASAQGWNPDEWREVCEAIAEHTHWSRPAIPDVGDPASYSGAPIES